jgi:CrcB protein
MRALLLVGLGGGAGSMLRYAVALGMARAGVTDALWSTLTVNITGSLVLGFLARYLVAPGESSGPWLLLAVGLCGGYTTFSTFALDLVLLVERGAGFRAAAYAASSVVLSVLAVIAGMGIARALRTGS